MNKLEFNRQIENLANVAIVAGCLIAEKEIEPAGHIDLVEKCIAIANQFEDEVASKVDYNTPPAFDNLRDYWIEIDEYATQKLKEIYPTGGVK